VKLEPTVNVDGYQLLEQMQPNVRSSVHAQMQLVQLLVHVLHMIQLASLMELNVLLKQHAEVMEPKLLVKPMAQMEHVNGLLQEQLDHADLENVQMPLL
jgi:hypothetical protein